MDSALNTYLDGEIITTFDDLIKEYDMEEVMGSSIMTTETLSPVKCTPSIRVRDLFAALEVNGNAGMKRKARKMEAGRKEISEEVDRVGLRGEPMDVVEDLMEEEEDISSSELGDIVMKLVHMMDVQVRLNGDTKGLVKMIQEGINRMVRRDMRKVEQEGMDRKEILGKVEHEGMDRKETSGKVEQEGTDRKETSRKVEHEGMDRKETLGKVEHEGMDRKETSGKVEQEGMDRKETSGKVKHEGMDRKETSGKMEQEGMDRKETSGKVEQEGMDRKETSGKVEKEGMDRKETSGKVEHERLDRKEISKKDKDRDKDKDKDKDGSSQDESGKLEWRLVGGRCRWRDPPLPPLPNPRLAPISGFRDVDARSGSDRVEQRCLPKQQIKVRPKPPLCSAVMIAGRAAGFTYAAALRKAREQINLEALGIETTYVRKAVNGGCLIEIPGKDSRVKAEELGMRLREVLKDTAIISCPTKKCELRITGFDESVSPEEITRVLSSFGGCSAEDVKTGPIRTFGKGLGMVWAQLPVVAAMKLADIDRIRLGWMMARVELLKTRPLQCFRCWKYGHTQNMCHSVMDRRGSCFKCGKYGHMASTCRSAAHCALCHEDGLQAAHRLGGPQCVVVQVHQSSVLRDRKPTRTNQDGA